MSPLADTLPVDNNAREMTARSEGSATITVDTWPRLERARQRLPTKGGKTPTWYRLAKENGIARPTLTKIKKTGGAQKKSIDLGTARKLARALNQSLDELFVDLERPIGESEKQQHAMPADELDELIEQALIAGRHTFFDCLAVKELAKTVTIHPKGHAGGIDLIRALLDVASIIRLSNEGPATPETMMRQIAHEVASVHPLRDARTPEEAIGQLLKTGKAKSGPISKPKIPVRDPKPPKR